MLGEIIAICAIVLILGGAVFYIVKAKKSGKKCIGCPGGCCGCQRQCGKKERSDGEEQEPPCCRSRKEE